ncbi:MAG: hypothetical protein LBL27_02130 [Coriobacteriales bacterium]|jgi:hypothetical protein|nr:hypothetical protein [Coriobacteriales bacterium]
MDNQTLQGTPQPNVPSNTPSPSNSVAQEAARPVVLKRSADAQGVSPKALPKKPPLTKKKKRKKAASSQGPIRSQKLQATEKSKRGRFSRKQILIGLIAFVLLFDIAILSLGFLSGAGPKVAPYDDPIALIQGQLSTNKSIAEIGHDSALKFESYPNMTIVNTSNLKPIENDLLKRGAGQDGTDALYDEQIVKRTLQLNSDWVSYLNQDDQTMFASIKKESPAQAKMTELGADSLVAYHRLALGEIRHAGRNYYIITRASYTLTQGGQLDAHDEVFVYKLVAQSGEMVVVDLERLAPLVTAPEPVESEPTANPEDVEGMPAEGDMPVEGEMPFEGELPAEDMPAEGDMPVEDMPIEGTPSESPPDTESS